MHGGRKCKCAAIEFCSEYYKTRSWVEGYAVPIFPIRHPSEWGVPNDIQQIVILPPICKVKREDLGGKGFHQLGKGCEIVVDESFNPIKGSPFHPAHDTPSTGSSSVIPYSVLNDVTYNMLIRIDEKLTNQTDRMQTLELRIQNVQNLLMQRTDIADWVAEARSKETDIDEFLRQEF
ncbi:Uncharacterized protein TCM_035981 [Theobroma cacao]|uniref:Uncharacterized protein n=1 Tax=Theobroma cacao TaxID=3641 RepID=A0A061FQV1_THECC|nr:Uncharacterized protein TCM_035981 [Theobroma cacao]